MRHRFRRNHFADQRSPRRGWLAAGEIGTSVVDACHDELTLIATHRGGNEQRSVAFPGPAGRAVS